MEPVTKKIVISCEYCKALFKVSESLSGRQVTCNTCKRPFTALETHVKSPKQEDEAVFLCKIALHYGLATEKNLEAFFAEYSRLIKHGQNPGLERLLMTHAHLSEDKIDLIKGIRMNWDLRLSEKHYAEYAVKKGFITPEQAKTALIAQAQVFSQTKKIKLIKDILIEKKILTPDQGKLIFHDKESETPVQKKPAPEPPPDPPRKPSSGLEAIKKAVEASKAGITQTHVFRPLSVEKKPDEQSQLRSHSLFGKGSSPLSSHEAHAAPVAERPARPVPKAILKSAALYAETRPHPEDQPVQPPTIEQTKTDSPVKPLESLVKNPEPLAQTDKNEVIEAPAPIPSTITEANPQPQTAAKEPPQQSEAPVINKEPQAASPQEAASPVSKSELDDIDSLLFPGGEPSEPAPEQEPVSGLFVSPAIDGGPVRTSRSTKTVEDLLGDDSTYLSMPHDEQSDKDNQDDDDDERRSKGPRIVTTNGIELIISPDGLFAHLKVPEEVDPAFATVENIKNVLAEEHIIYGIVEDALIRGFLNSKIFREKPFKIAEGLAPIKGQNGSVKYHFDTDYLKVGKVTESGGIDFRNRGEIPFVKEDTLLAEITPAILGKSGIDIYGNDLLVPQVREIALKCEAGTKMSDDKRKVYAAVSGQPKLNFGDRLFVLSELVIPGDVSFKTGHIDFAGNVIIKGTIQSDFTVKGANVTANDVLSARIIATGDVEIKNGISSSVIVAQGNVKAKFINKSTIKAYGNVITEREIIDCEIVNSGACLIEKGTIITSAIASKQGIQANAIGTETSRPCHIKIGGDDHINEEVALIDNEIEGVKARIKELSAYLKDLGKKQKQIEKTIAKLAHIQDRSQLEQKKYRESLMALGDGNPDKREDLKGKIEAIDNTIRMADSSINQNFDEQDVLLTEMDSLNAQISTLNEKIDYLSRQKKDMVAWVQQIKAMPSIKTKGPIFSGTSITGIYCTRVLKETMRAAHITEVKSPDAPEGWEIRIG